jgi:NAD(P)-dependent dehydrogenase (short-subunit alcohol dehydrogenase family)
MLAKGVAQKKCFGTPCSIVFMSSVMGIVGRPASSIYSASKGALNAMSTSLAVELARKGIRVNTVCPGQVQTEMDDAIRKRLGVNLYQSIVDAHPLGLGKPEDVAGTVAFLLSDMSRWITGTHLVVDGGYTAI